jgi:hypothetical protein
MSFLFRWVVRHFDCLDLDDLRQLTNQIEK